MKNKNSINFCISPFRLEGKKIILEYMVVIIDECGKK